MLLIVPLSLMISLTSRIIMVTIGNGWLMVTIADILKKSENRKPKHQVVEDLKHLFQPSRVTSTLNNANSIASFKTSKYFSKHTPSE